MIAPPHPRYTSEPWPGDGAGMLPLHLGFWTAQPPLPMASGNVLFGGMMVLNEVAGPHQVKPR